MKQARVGHSLAPLLTPFGVKTSTDRIIEALMAQNVSKQYLEEGLLMTFLNIFQHYGNLS